MSVSSGHIFITCSWCKYGSILTTWKRLWVIWRSSFQRLQSECGKLFIVFFLAGRKSSLSFVLGLPVKEDQQPSSLEPQLSRFCESASSLCGWFIIWMILQDARQLSEQQIIEKLDKKMVQIMHERKRNNFHLRIGSISSCALCSWVWLDAQGNH